MVLAARAAVDQYKYDNEPEQSRDTAGQCGLGAGQNTPPKTLLWERQGHALSDVKHDSCKYSHGKTRKFPLRGALVLGLSLSPTEAYSQERTTKRRRRQCGLFCSGRLWYRMSPAAMLGCMDRGLGVSVITGERILLCLLVCSRCPAVSQWE